MFRRTTSAKKKQFARRLRRRGSFTKAIQLQIEKLERRDLLTWDITPGFITGDGAEESLRIGERNGFYIHDQFLGPFGFTGPVGATGRCQPPIPTVQIPACYDSDQDFNAYVPGEQALPIGTPLTIFGGPGNDFIEITALVTNLIIHGGEGDDTIIVNEKAPTAVEVFGEDGDDFIHVFSEEGGTALIDGGDGADHLVGGDGIDTFMGGDGDDVIEFTGSGFIADGGPTDVLAGGSGGDTVKISGSDALDFIAVAVVGPTLTVSHFTTGDPLAVPDVVTSGISSIELIDIDMGAGSDIVAITAAFAGPQFHVDGGIPYGAGDAVPAGDGDKLLVLEAFADIEFKPGGGRGEGSIELGIANSFPFAGKDISYTNIETAFVAAGTFGIEFYGTTGDDHIVVEEASVDLGPIPVSFSAGVAVAHADMTTVVVSDATPKITLLGLQGDDKFTLEPEPGDLTDFVVDGGDLDGEDSLAVVGHASDPDQVTYTPDPGIDSDGEIQINSVDITYTSIDAVELYGRGGEDELVAEGTVGNDFVNYLPSITENSGAFQVTTDDRQFSPVTFHSFEDREFDTKTGVDVLVADAGDLPGANSGVTIVGGSTQTTFTFGSPGAAATKFTHDADQMDTLSLELPTFHDTVDITPGTGVQFALNVGDGENFVTYHAGTGEDLHLDLDSATASNDGTLGQKNSTITLSQGMMYGPVVMTGVTRLNVDAGGQALTVEHGLLPGGTSFRRTDSISDRLQVKPSGPTSGVLSLDAELQPNVSFHEVTQLNLHAQGGALLYEGTDLPEQINVVQEQHNTVDLRQRIGTAGSTVDFVPVQAIGYDQAFIDSGRSADFLRVDVKQCVADNSCTPGGGAHPAQSEDNKLAFSIHGGNGKDQLIVVDDGVGDTILRREEVNEQSGFVQVGLLNAVDYTEVEVTSLFPFDPVSAGTGADRMGREVILEADPLEPNDNRLAAHPVETLAGVNRDPNIGEPAVDLFGDTVLGDEDWVSFSATTTGTYRFFLVFDDVATLENGQPGLPGNGDLDLTIYDAAGTFLADGKPLDILGTDIPNLTPNANTPHVVSQTVDANGNQVCDGGMRPDPRSPTVCRQIGVAGEFVDIGVEEGTTVYARVRGHTPEAVNNYDVFVLSPLDLAAGTIADQGRDSDLGTDAEEISDPPGGGLRIVKTEINSFDTSAMDDRPNCETGLYEAGCRTIFPTDLKVTPTFQVESITLFVESFPPRAPGFQYEAIHETIAHQLGNYELVGQHSGPIEFDAITVVNDEVVLGETAKGTVTLHFEAPLPDDRYTLIVRDTLVDPAIRPLDGETNAIIPVDVDHFKSGNGVPGGDFIGKFTVDTRVEVGTFYAGSFWLDLNGNGIFDPDNPDPLNRDVVYQFGENEELVDKTVIGDWDGDGFDEIGLFALDPSSGNYRFRLDRNSNGIFDPGNDPEDDPQLFEFLPNSGAGVEPVVGDWDGDGTDNIGVLSTGQWILDIDDNKKIDFATELFPTNFTGLPFAGDWDGTGTVRVGTYDLHAGKFRFDIDGDRVFKPLNDLEIEYQVPGLERPLVGDFDADFDTNIGLLIADTTNVFPGVIAQWLLDLGDPTANPLMELTDAVDGNDDFADIGSPGDGQFQPAPTGNSGTPQVYQDYFFQVRDARFAPVVGNWDLPLTRPVDPSPPVSPPVPPPPPSGNPFHNDALPTDVNNDSTTTSADANEVAIFLGMNGIQPISSLTFAGKFLDVDNDELITPQDYLAVISFLGGGGEGEAHTTLSRLATVGWYKNSVDPADVNLDGVIGSTDALAIVNQINAHGIQMELDISFDGKFLDPNGDGFVTGRDFLFVANILNNRAADGGEGEGENPAEAGGLAATSSVSLAMSAPTVKSAPSPGQATAIDTAILRPDADVPGAAISGLVRTDGANMDPVALQPVTLQPLTPQPVAGKVVQWARNIFATPVVAELTSNTNRSGNPVAHKDFETLEENLLELLACDVSETWKSSQKSTISTN